MKTGTVWTQTVKPPTRSAPLSEDKMHSSQGKWLIWRTGCMMLTASAQNNPILAHVRLELLFLPPLTRQMLLSWHVVLYLLPFSPEHVYQASPSFIHLDDKMWNNFNLICHSRSRRLSMFSVRTFLCFKIHWTKVRKALADNRNPSWGKYLRLMIHCALTIRLAAWFTV